MRLRDHPECVRLAVLRAERHGWNYECSDFRGAYLTIRERDGRLVAILVLVSGRVSVAGN
jgi:hypothetical protein